MRKLGGRQCWKQYIVSKFLLLLFEKKIKDFQKMSVSDTGPTGFMSSNSVLYMLCQADGSCWDTTPKDWYVLVAPNFQLLSPNV